MKNNNLQYRSLATTFETDVESRKIHGLAIPVNSRSQYIRDNLGEYYEIILPSAVNEDLILKNDVKIYLDHDMSQGTFARSKFGKGSLSLMVTERGLEFEFEAPNTVFGNALLEGITRGDYDAVSFAFKPGKDKWDYDENRREMHYIESFAKLAEISILSLQPAFQATDVELRSLEDFRKEQEDKYNESLAKLDDIENNFNELYSKYLDVTY